MCLTSLTGCLRHSATVSSGTYRFRDVGGVTILEPPINELPGTSQRVATVTLGDAPQTKSLARDEGRCSIQTKMFSFESGETSNRWVVRSPRARDLAVSATQNELADDWMNLLVKLTNLEQAGCFPAQETTYSIQRAIATAIPIPADQALLFFYSLTGSGYVDLEPGLQIKVGSMSSAEGVIGSGTEVFSQYKVVPRSTVGVELQLAGKSKDAAKHTASDASLPATFASSPFLRLFLEQGATDSSKPRRAALLGGLTNEALDRDTKAVLGDGSNPCKTIAPPSTCVVFPQGGVSVLSAITVNGREMLYGPGTTLGQLLDAVPDNAKQKALATVTVQRPLSSGYATLTFQREMDATSKVILINGDRIHWAK